MSLPDKHPDIIDTIRICIENGHYLDTRHGSERQAERQITRPDILYVLKSGFHEKKKDRYDALYQAWNYAVRGKTIDQRVLRVIVSFDKNGMLIITAIVLKR